MIHHLCIVCFVVLDFKKNIVVVVYSFPFESCPAYWSFLEFCGTTKVGATHACIF